MPGSRESWLYKIQTRADTVTQEVKGCYDQVTGREGQTGFWRDIRTPTELECLPRTVFQEASWHHIWLPDCLVISPLGNLPIPRRSLELLIWHARYLQPEAAAPSKSAGEWELHSLAAREGKDTEEPHVYAHNIGKGVFTVSAELAIGILLW